MNVDKMVKGFVERRARKEGIEERPMIMFIKALNKPELVGAEIGVLEGIHAYSIFNLLSIKKLYLIDPYAVYPEYLDITTPFGYFAEQRADARLEPFIDKIVKIKKFSADAVEDVPDELDFVYIDGNHSYEYVLEDIENYLPKVKKGGVVGGHDYYNKGPAREVKKAVDEFVQENNLKLYYKDIDWWIVK